MQTAQFCAPLITSPVSRKRRAWMIYLLLLFAAFIGCSGPRDFQHNYGITGTSRPKVSILTLNLMGTSPVMPIPDRLKILETYITRSSAGNEPIDILLLQEGIGGLVARTRNSIDDLATNLAQHGLYYDVATSSMSSPLVRPFIDYKVGIMSLHEASPGATANLGVREISRGFIEDHVYSYGSRIIQRQIRIDGFGRINAYSVHLSGAGGLAGFERQAQELLAFINQCELAEPADVSIIGGDFNLELDRVSSEQPIIAALTNLGFQGIPGAAPTFSVPGNPHIEPGKPKRLDGFFIKGKVQYTQKVVLNTPNYFVSDHCGVLLTLSHN